MTYATEHEIEDYLTANPEEIEPGLTLIARQPKVGSDKDGRRVIVELKADALARNAVAQPSSTLLGSTTRDSTILPMPSPATRTLSTLNRSPTSPSQVAPHSLLRPQRKQHASSAHRARR